MIYFITRSLYPFHSAGGGIARYLQVRDLARAGEQVKVVLPLEEKTRDLRIAAEVYDASIEFVRPRNPVSINVGRGLQALGIFDDYLTGWAREAHRLLKREVKPTDTVLATSGGELGALQLGAMLKAETGCRLVHHLHDPPDHVDIEGLRVPSRYPHRNRRRAFEQFLRVADQVYTTNTHYGRHLVSQYKLKAVGCRYIFDRDLGHFDDRLATGVPNYAYGGNMSTVQRPELFHPAWTAARATAPSTLTFVGSTSELTHRGAVLDGAVCLPTMARDAFVRYSRTKIDVGLVSLYDPYHAYCTPSKFFDSIMMAIPLITVGSGDLADLVVEHDLGVTSKPGDVTALTAGMVRMADPDDRARVRSRVISFAELLLSAPMYPGGV